MYEYLDRRYALALYKVAEEKNKVNQYLEELGEIAGLLKNNEYILTVLKHPDISTSKKKKTFIQLFKGRIDEELLSFLLILIDKDRILYLEEKLNEMEKIHLEKNNTLLAQVKTVIPLNNYEKDALVSRLEKLYGKKILLKEELESDIIGGVFVRVGSDVIDGTIRTRLREMREAIIRQK